MGGTVGRCSSDEPTHARQMNQKSDLLNAKILSACEPHYNIYNQWKIIASGCNELLCDIQTRLTYKRDALKLPKQINMWNKQTLKLEIIHHIERNGIISLKRIETLAEGVKNMKKKHFNEYVRDVAMSLPLISFTLPTTEHLFTDPSPQRYYIPKRCAFKEEAVGFYGENVWYMLLDLVIDITVSEKRKNRYLAMLYTHECNDLMCLNDRTGVIVLKNMMDKLFETKTVTSSQTQKLYKMNELNHQTNEDVVMNEILIGVKQDLNIAKQKLNELHERQANCEQANAKQRFILNMEVDTYSKRVDDLEAQLNGHDEAKLRRKALRKMRQNRKEIYEYINKQNQGGNGASQKLHKNKQKFLALCIEISQDTKAEIRRNLCGTVLNENRNNYWDFMFYDNLYEKICHHHGSNNMDADEAFEFMCKLDDVFEFLDGAIMPNRMHSRSRYSEMGFSGSIRSQQAKRCKTKQSQGLWCCRNKHKDFVRQKHVNRWFMQYKIKSCHTWWLLKQQSNEVMIYECDCASVKKVGTKESNCEQRETKLLISAKDLELGRFGDDQSSEFAENLLFLRPISYIFLSGKVVDGRLVRSAGKHLQFNLVAPTSVSKGDAFDMKSGLEYILTNFPEHSDFLLHPPAYDELHDSKIEYKLLFMAFRHRIRLARFFIMHLGIAIDVLFDIKRDSHKLNGTVHQQLQKLSFYIKQNCDHFYKSSTDYLKNEGNELALHDILQQITVKAGQLSIEADVIIGMLNSEQIWEKYLEGELSDHLECELHDVFNEIFELLDPITTISVKKVNVNSSDGGTGVTCYEKNVRYVEAAWSIIAKVDINEKNHTSKGDSKFNKVECVNADAKSKTIMNAPISPTECIAFYDIAGKDLSVIDWSKVGNESKKKWALNQAYINAATYAEMLDGQKSCKSYVQCRVFPPPPDTLDSYRFTPLFNADMVFLFKASKKTKNPFHCVLKRLENVLKHHAYLQHRSRLSIDMNPSHYLSSNPDQCVYEHHHHQNTIGTHIVKLSPYGEWGQTRNPKTNEMEPWFVYPAINCDSPTVNLEAKAKADEEVPVLVFKQRIHAMSLELYDSFFAQIKDISGTDPLKIQTLHLPDNIESLISEFHAKYGVRKRDWLQYLIHEMHLARYLKSVQKANDDEDPQSGSSDDDVPIYVRRIPVIPIIPSETTSADDSSSNDYTSSETDRYEDTSDYSSSDYSSFESSE
eukprot:165939_1